MRAKRFSFYFLGAVAVAALGWAAVGAYGHVPHASAVEPGIAVSAITVTGTDPVPGQANTFYTAGALTLTARVTNNGSKDITAAIQNQFSYGRTVDTISNSNVWADGAATLSREYLTPIAGLKKEESKSVTATFRNAASFAGPGTYYIKLVLDRFYEIHAASDPSIESPAVRIVLVGGKQGAPPPSTVEPGIAVSAIAVSGSTTNCQSVGTRQGNTVTYPPGTRCFNLYWQTSGSGDGASQFRSCVVKGNETTKNVSVLGFPTSTCQGEVSFPTLNGQRYEFTLSYKSEAVGAADTSGKPLTGEEKLTVVIGTPPPPTYRATSTPVLPGTISPPKPEYREL
ncbi:MAG: hypothetical protein HYW65_00720 [Candidatus Liptonbacteria bacterium]|nr:hypothetical protein [Candidatus Liptonbacteria bacterium]